MFLNQLLNLPNLLIAIEDGFVRATAHPVLPYVIYNYTEKAQFAREWNKVTQQCRGLIVAQTELDKGGVVVARPFDKFFNAGELGPSKLGQALSGVVEVTDKMDGSLGIMYPSPLHRTGYAIATRGSFTSEQALHATQLLNDQHADFLRGSISSNWTYLFEIVYPQNRIVLDYGQRDELVLLGARSIIDGKILGPDELTEWDGPRTQVFPVHSFKDAKALPDRPNAEGIVVRNLKTGFMVKIKQDDYVALHKLVTGMNERAVWERLGAGETPDDLCMSLPEEFWPWVYEVGGKLLVKSYELHEAALAEFNAIVSELDPGSTRKDFALEAQRSDNRALLFLLLDGRDIFEPIWRSIKPAGNRTMVASGEDVA